MSRTGAVPERFIVSTAVMAAMAVEAPRGDEMLDSDLICGIMILTHGAVAQTAP
jgi:hypothetical protein